METKTDESFGVVPVIKNDTGDWEVLLINQINQNGGTFWGFPKGHRDGNESGEQAARRELLEEANIELHNLELAHPFIQYYSFVEDGVLINKTVTYYLGYATHKEYIVQAKEVAEARWCDFTSAKNLITHENNKQLLDEVGQFLNNNK